MPGRHVSGARPSATVSATGRTAVPRHSTATGPRAFAGTPLTFDGITRDAMGASSLLGSSIAKGPLAFTIGASHGAAAYTVTSSQAAAQVDIGGAVAGIDVISKSRALRAVARNAEGIAPTSTSLSMQSPRMAATGRGPLVSVLGMVAGDIARTVAEFDRYGYTVNRAMVPPRLDPMEHRSYWQTADTTVLGAMSQSARQAVATAFERGTTVWTSVAEIGSQTANLPRTGVVY